MKKVESTVYTVTSLDKAWGKRSGYAKYLVDNGELGTCPLGSKEVIPDFEAERYLRSIIRYKIPKNKNMR